MADRATIQLAFTERPDEIHGVVLHATVPLLENSVGPAEFTINSEIWGGGYKVVFWHGNRGHRVAHHIDTEAEARGEAQRHLDALVAALTAAPPEGTE